MNKKNLQPGTIVAYSKDWRSYIAIIRKPLSVSRFGVVGYEATSLVSVGSWYPGKEVHLSHLPLVVLYLPGVDGDGFHY